MKFVKITIKSSSGDDEISDKLTVVAYGQMALRGGKYYVLYDETSLTGMEGTSTTIKWDEQSVMVLRKGTYSSRQEYREGCSCEGVYTTPYLAVTIKSTTKNVKVKKVNKIWCLHIEYDMEIAQVANGNVTLDIEIEEDVSSEH